MLSLRKHLERLIDLCRVNSNFGWLVWNAVYNGELMKLLRADCEIYLEDIECMSRTVN